MPLRGVTRGVILAIALTPAIARAQSAPLPLQARFLTSGPVYVGQPVELEVVTVGGRQRPVVTVPERSAVTLAPAGTMIRPIASSGIGEAVSETNQYRLRFRVVPSRTGTMLIPALRVESSGRHGFTTPLRRDVRPVPAAGRPATFLGGVGRITPTAEVVPASVRVGEPFEVRIRLEGPGSIASTAPVDRSRLAALAIGPEIEPLPDDVTENPPVRVRRLRVRPTRAGSVIIPPWSVSWFDPATGRFQTAATAALPVRVADVEQLDVARIPYGRSSGSPWPAWWIAGLAGAAALLVLAGLSRRFRRRRRAVDAAALAGLMASRFDRAPDQADPQAEARRVMEALIDYLHQTQDRPTGVLTPDEARAAFDPWGSGPSTQVERLVRECDRALFSGQDRDARWLAVEARTLFAALAEHRKRSAPGPSTSEGAVLTPSDRR
jgi:hypothetical protein